MSRWLPARSWAWSPTRSRRRGDDAPPSSPLECLVSQGFLHGGDDGDDGFVPLTPENGKWEWAAWFPSHSWRGGESVNSSSLSSPHDVSPCQHRANEGDDGFRGPSPPSPLGNCPATRIMRSRSLRGRVRPIRGKLSGTVQFQQVVVSSEVMTVLRSWSWLPSQETMQQMAKKATAVYVESVEDLRGSPPHVD